jgi:hypothetical protein
MTSYIRPKSDHLKKRRLTQQNTYFNAYVNGSNGFIVTFNGIDGKFLSVIGQKNKLSGLGPVSLSKICPG